MSTPTANANLEGHSSNKIQHVETTKMMAHDINHTFGDKCALSLGDLCKLIVRPLGDVVAMGTIVENQSAYSIVSIDVVVDKDASLPIPNEVEGLIFFRDASDDILCGTFYSFISVEDLKVMINLKELGGTHTCLYIRHLYNKLKDSNAPNVHGFINPIHVSLSGFVNNAEKRAQRVRYLIDRLKSAGHNDILFMPYNPR
ncbi:hypothetical protein QYF36_016952 [Acer negundo]|nr:hypothetical protein QYF36_016952 [Acer negundo]